MTRGARICGCAALVLGLGCASTQTSLFDDVGPADEVYAEGVEALAGRNLIGLYTWIDYDEAIELFQSVIDNYPYSEYAVLAELRIADAYYQDLRYDEALSYYRDFAELHPQNEKVPYTILRAALCHYNQVRSVEQDQTATKSALLELERLIRNYPYASETRKGEELLRELRTRLRETRCASATSTGSQRIYLGAERYRSLLDTYPGLGEDAVALFKLGVCYENMKREDEATRIFQVIAENFPETHLAVLAREHISASD